MILIFKKNKIFFESRKKLSLKESLLSNLEILFNYLFLEAHNLTFNLSLVFI